jgi:hypothetical protein
MKRALLLALLVFSLSTPQKVVAQASARSMANPQLVLVGARLMTLGGTNPTISGDINGVLINPASIGNLGSMPFSTTSQKILEQYDYKVFSLSAPLDFTFPVEDKTYTQTVFFGLTYGSAALEGIPETVFQDGRIRQTGAYSSGFDVFYGNAGTQFFDIFGFDIFSAGIGTKIIRQFLGGESRFGFGLDVGGIGTYYMDIGFLDKIHVGASFINIFGTPLVWASNKDEAFQPQNVFVGARADLFNDEISLYAHNSLLGLAVSGEYFMGNNIVLRSGTDFKRLSFGTGLVLENITGFEKRNFSLRLDYNLTFNAAPFDKDTNHTLSLTVMGETRPFIPKILEPFEDILTRQSRLLIRGVGPKDTAIQIFNNDSLTRTTLTNKFGHWRFKNFPIHEGKNELHVKSYKIEKDVSQDSERIMVTLDTTPPVLDVRVFPYRDEMKVVVTSREKISDVEGAVGRKPLPFEESDNNQWQAAFEVPEDLKDGAPMPSRMKSITVRALDEIGNVSEEPPIPFFVEVDYPRDKTIHYKESIRMIGETSPLVKFMKLDDHAIYIDPVKNFSIAKRLKPGKNLIKLHVTTLEDNVITYMARVLRLVAYDDVGKKIKQRREIEFMSTLGILVGDDDGNFRPNSVVTRGWLTKVMIKAAKVPVDMKNTNSFFSDVTSEDPNTPYIQAAIENGLVFAFPDGTFRPEQELNYNEVIFMLSNAEVIDESEVEDGEEIVTRKALAEFLAYNPRYELKIERLIDWEKGYK